MPATHCEAELGRYVSVPRVCRTCRRHTGTVRQVEAVADGERGLLGPYVVLDLAASVDVDGQPSLLVLRLDIGVFGCQRVLHLQTGSNSSHLSVPRVRQHFGQLHQECGLKEEEQRSHDERQTSGLSYGETVSVKEALCRSYDAGIFTGAETQLLVTTAALRLWFQV